MIRRCAVVVLLALAPSFVRAAEPVAPNRLARFLPATPAGWAAHEASLETAPSESGSFESMASRSYVGPSGSGMRAAVDVLVRDLGDGGDVGAAVETGCREIGAACSPIDVAGFSGQSAENAEAHAAIVSVVVGRFLVQAEGVAVPASTLHDWLASVPLGELAALGGR
jgi:hypothetical protein